MYALPCRHRKGGETVYRQRSGIGCALWPIYACDDRHLDLRPGSGGDEPGQAGAQAFPRGGVMSGRLRALRRRRCNSSSTARTSRRARARPSGRSRRHGTEIPHLCWLPEPGYRADGNCRACMVEIEGERVLAASCIRKPARGHEGEDRDERAKKARKMVFELLVADQPARATAHDPNLALLALGRCASSVDDSRFPPRERRRPTAQPPGDGGESRRLHPLQSVRARLPRGAGQRRDRHGLSAATAPRSCSTSTIRWAAAPASPAASACRPARPAR